MSTISFGPEIDKIMNTLNVPLDVRERLANRGLSLATAAHVDKTDMNTARVPPITARALLHELKKLSEPTHCLTRVNWEPIARNQLQVSSSSSPSSSLDMEMTQLADDEDTRVVEVKEEDYATMESVARREQEGGLCRVIQPSAFDYVTGKCSPEEVAAVEAKRDHLLRKLHDKNVAACRIIDELSKEQAKTSRYALRGANGPFFWTADVFGDILVSIHDPRVTSKQRHDLALDPKFSGLLFDTREEAMANRPVGKAVTMEDFNADQSDIASSSTEDNTVFGDDEFGDVLIGILGATLDDPSASLPESIALQAKFQAMKERAATHPEEFTEEQLEILNASTPGDVKEELTCFIKTFSDAFNEPVAATSSSSSTEDSTGFCDEELGNALLNKLESMVLRVRSEIDEEEAEPPVTQEEPSDEGGPYTWIDDDFGDLPVSIYDPRVSEEHRRAILIKLAAEKAQDRLNEAAPQCSAGDEVIRAALDGPTVEIGPSSIDIPFNFTLESKREFIYTFGGPLVEIGPASSSISNDVHEEASREFKAMLDSCRPVYQ